MILKVSNFFYKVGSFGAVGSSNPIFLQLVWNSHPIGRGSLGNDCVSAAGCIKEKQADKYQPAC